MPLLLALLALAACNDGPPWATRSVGGLLPPLELRLSGTPRGMPFTQADVRDRTTLLTFGFMSCSDVCPTTLARLAEAKRRLPAPLSEQVQVVFVSVDPARDDPARLADYAAHFGDGFIGVTGTPEELRALGRRYRTTYSYGRPDPHGNYDVVHSAGVYVFDRDGEARLLFQTDDPPEAMCADLLRLLVEADKGQRCRA
ncbi:SCO family protein [Luteimonas sp. R10]|uniref:SCO family protein n=1 Tax=Luteimonas sp. R10 TaxID=3108176 RepID=UPI0030886456|nr:SCO family protein [Luteimonas sp. R10]